MPIVHVNMMQGRTKAQKKALIEQVTKAVESSIGAPPQSIRVIIHEVPPENWGIAGVPKE